MKIGVLAIQGSVIEHQRALEKIGVEAVLVRSVGELEKVQGLIMPGGESTVISKLLKKTCLDEAIKARVKAGMAIWGTCAGAILLAKVIVGKDGVETLGLMDITIERNGYGRQLDSFETQLEFDLGRGSAGRIVPAIFIRAPKIVKVGEGVEILAESAGEIVAAREGNMLATNFHPELTEETVVHEYFVRLVF